jgi:hypothetical protein
MRRYKIIQFLIDRSVFHVVVQFETGYYFTGTYDMYGLKLDQGNKFISQYDAEKKLIEMHF